MITPESIARGQGLRREVRLEGGVVVAVRPLPSAREDALRAALPEPEAKRKPASLLGLGGSKGGLVPDRHDPDYQRETRAWLHRWAAVLLIASIDAEASPGWSLRLETPWDMPAPPPWHDAKALTKWAYETADTWTERFTSYQLLEAYERLDALARPDAAVLRRALVVPVAGPDDGGGGAGGVGGGVVGPRATIDDLVPDGHALSPEFFLHYTAMRYGVDPERLVNEKDPAVLASMVEAAKIVFALERQQVAAVLAMTKI